MTGSFLSFFVTVLLLGTFVAGDPLEKCQPRNVTYAIGDSAQCDKYHSCATSGKLTARLCDDGFVFSLSYSQCDYPHNVNCHDRPNLQPPQSAGDPNCPRMNGFYAFPPQISCQKFYHCLEGKAYEKTCPEGVIFDDTKGACVHPDLASRSECSATEVLDFTCPNKDKPFSKLKFGNHDRFRNPDDCRKFYICMQNGSPRIGSCPVKTVFNPKTGKCDSPKQVPECADYYIKNPITDLAVEGLDDVDGHVEDKAKTSSTVAPSKTSVKHQEG